MQPGFFDEDLRLTKLRGLGDCRFSGVRYLSTLILIGL